MEQDTLLSLFKSKELEEREIIAELVRVSSVLAQRQTLVQDLRANQQSLLGQVKGARKLLLRTNVGNPDLIRQVEEGRAKIEQVRRKLESSEEDLNRAKERVDLVQGRLASTRLEKLRIEKLIDESNLAKLIKRNVVEEIGVEESAAGHRSKDEWS
jgi:hypothetical protein